MISEQLMGQIFLLPLTVKKILAILVDVCQTADEFKQA
jgi:hypothetical protein